MLLLITILFFVLYIIYKSKSYNYSDPVKHCQVYKNNGCAFVDDNQCNINNCTILKEYIKNHNKTD